MSGAAPATLRRLGWDEGWEEAFVATVAGLSSLDAAAACRARVIRTHRFGYDVADPTGRRFAVTPQRIRDPLAAPATGDWVVLTAPADAEDPFIVAVVPRRTALVRRDPADRAAPQVLAANVDVVAIVQAADRPVNERRLERLLALAHGSGAQVVAVLTKADLDREGSAAAALRDAVRGYVEVLVTAAREGIGIDAVDALTDPRRTMVLVGESGAGKSSLVNAVLGVEAVAVGGVREGDRKGRHTTTRRELLLLPTGGALLDTPGVRAVGLWPSASDLDAAFADVAEMAVHCRFADCSHLHEPDCAVRAAAEDGRLDPDRVAAYLQLRAELDATAEEVERQRWR